MSRRPLSLLVTAALLALGLHSGPARAAASCRNHVATIEGTEGSDDLTGTPGPDVIAAGPGADRVDGRGGRDLICGGPGNDVLLGGRDRDRVVGQGGDDRFLLGIDRGDDYIYGGRGRDWTDHSAPSSSGEPTGAEGPARVNLTRGTARQKGAGLDSLSLIENVYGTGLGDTIIGDGDANQLVAGLWGGGVLRGRGGSDVLATGEDGGTTFKGGAGDDYLNAFTGDNVVDGGDGSDTLTFCRFGHGATSLPVEVDLATGTSTVTGPGYTDDNQLTRIENAITCHGDDVLRGDDGPNRLSSGGGEDALEGRGGDDTLQAGAGQDSADGGDGIDACTGAETATSCE